VTFGMYDDDDGLYIEIEGTQWLRACVKRGVVTQRRPRLIQHRQTDGNGPSKVVPDPMRDTYG
jgi:hypothetical protein